MLPLGSQLAGQQLGLQQVYSSVPMAGGGFTTQVAYYPTQDFTAGMGTPDGASQLTYSTDLAGQSLTAVDASMSGAAALAGLNFQNQQRGYSLSRQLQQAAQYQLPSQHTGLVGMSGGDGGMLARLQQQQQQQLSMGLGSRTVGGLGMVDSAAMMAGPAASPGLGMALNMAVPSGVTMPLGQMSPAAYANSLQPQQLQPSMRMQAPPSSSLPSSAASQQPGPWPGPAPLPGMMPSMAPSMAMSGNSSLMQMRSMALGGRGAGAGAATQAGQQTHNRPTASALSSSTLLMTGSMISAASQGLGSSNATGSSSMLSAAPSSTTGLTTGASVASAVAAAAGVYDKRPMTMGTNAMNTLLGGDREGGSSGQEGGRDLTPGEVAKGSANNTGEGQADGQGAAAGGTAQMVQVVDSEGQVSYYFPM
ncbi:hypothetical protein V8C86DRAFT_1200572 [Haematococcus lacustris]